MNYTQFKQAVGMLKATLKSVYYECFSDRSEIFAEKLQKPILIHALEAFPITSVF